MNKLLFAFSFVFLASVKPNSSAQNFPVELPQGWSMFGYTCLESVDVIDAFSDVSQSIIIVKDHLGNAYLPNWAFNGIGELEFAKGYQIKLSEPLNDFQFCAPSDLLSDSSQALLSELQLELESALQTINNLQLELATIVAEDGISQLDVDLAVSTALANCANLCEPEYIEGCSWIAIWDPVCGCDETTYSNTSHASCYGITQYTFGECAQQNKIVGMWQFYRAETLEMMIDQWTGSAWTYVQEWYQNTWVDSEMFLVFFEDGTFVDYYADVPVNNGVWGVLEDGTYYFDYVFETTNTNEYLEGRRFINLACDNSYSITFENNADRIEYYKTPNTTECTILLNYMVE